MRQAQLRVSEAESLQRQALSMSQKLLGNDHSSVALGLNNLAILANAQGRAVEAERMFREALAIREQLSGKEHPRVLSNLTTALNRQGRFAEAEAVSCERLYVLAGLAGTLTNASGISNAIDVLTDMLQRNPDDTGVFFARGLLHGRQGRWQAAIADLNTAAALFPELPLLVLGPLYVETGDQAGFVRFRRQTLARWVGTEDPETAADAALVISIHPWEAGIALASRMADLAVSRGVDPNQLAHFEFHDILDPLNHPAHDPRPTAQTLCPIVGEVH